MLYLPEAVKTHFLCQVWWNKLTLLIAVRFHPLGMGHALLLTIVFNFLKSTQNRREPSAFLTNTTGNAQLLLLGLIIFACNMSSFVRSITSLCLTGVGYGLHLIGGRSPVSTCTLYALAGVKSLSVLASKSVFLLNVVLTTPSCCLLHTHSRSSTLIVV